MTVMMGVLAQPPRDAVRYFKTVRTTTVSWVRTGTTLQFHQRCMGSVTGIADVQKLKETGGQRTQRLQTTEEAGRELDKGRFANGLKKQHSGLLLSIPSRGIQKITMLGFCFGRIVRTL
jgi:hypothetical protein